MEYALWLFAIIVLFNIYALLSLLYIIVVVFLVFFLNQHLRFLAFGRSIMVTEAGMGLIEA